MKDLSVAAKALWAKKGKSGEMTWLPLYRHLADTVGVMRLLWQEWLPKATRERIAFGLSDPEQAQCLALFVAAAHDWGKAIVAFQARPAAFRPDDLEEMLVESLNDSGLLCDFETGQTNAKATPHGLASQVLLSHARCDEQVAAIVGAHHGKPASSQVLQNDLYTAYPNNFHMGKKGKEAWGRVQCELLAYSMRLAGVESLSSLPRPDFEAQMLLCGLLIAADWIASNEHYFPYQAFGEEAPDIDQEQRVRDAWRRMNLPQPWQYNAFFEPDYYWDRFAIKTPYPSQQAVAQIAGGISFPGILILEAPMGAGKTESALVAAEIFAGKSSQSGVFFALPTQATSNAIFPRLMHWVQRLDTMGQHAIRLAHGKAQFQEDNLSLMEGSRGIGEEKGDLVVHQWFEGNKKALLADFVVGTIDQFLMSALRQKHVMLRHLGLAGKVLILDEVHSYDSYMNRYLDQALRWMGAYRVPVIILSATLPAKRRTELVQAYLGHRRRAVSRRARLAKETLPEEPASWMLTRSYPLVTWTDNGQVCQQVLEKEGKSREVKLERLSDEALVVRLKDLLKNGGYAGVIVNTVRRAQHFFHALQEAFGPEQVTLVHSRLVAPDRAAREAGLLAMLGKPRKGDAPRSGTHIVVGTQVIEQSLDLDFDVLASDLCPMDLLLQRMGRLHRHVRSRPEGLHQARCLVLQQQDTGFEPGALSIYKALPLMRTRALLPKDQLVLPDDIPGLVQDVYDLALPLSDPPEGYYQAFREWENLISSLESRAGAYLLKAPIKGESLVDLLENMPGEAAGEAAVRDAGDSLEVLVLHRVKPGFYAPLPWIDSKENQPPVPADSIPVAQTARLMARQSLRLPPALCHPGIIDLTIRTLEKQNQLIKDWQASPWLKGQLFLLLDEELHAEICGYQLTYHRELGLLCLKEEGGDHGAKGVQPD